MATGSTPLLGLALPVTGELSGTWGDEVNNKLTSLVDSAIAGTTTLTDDGSSTYTLTSAALTANQARQAIILWNTNDAAKTATRTIIAPATSKQYVVINRSTYQSIKICAPGPTTGVTLAPSENCVVSWHSGTSDFVKIANNSLIGSATAEAAGLNNTFFGYEAGKAVTSPNGYRHVMIGWKAGTASTSGNSNIYIGWQAALNATTASFNTVLGYNGLISNTAGNNNVAIGNEAGYSVTSCSDSVLIGSFAKSTNNSSLNGAVIIGRSAGQDSTETGSVFVGYFAGRYQQSTSSTVCVGYNAGTGAAGANNSGLVAVGGGAAYSCNGAQYTTAIGYEALYTISSGDNNTALGYQAGRGATTGATNVFAGYQAGYAVTTGNNNTILGGNAAYSGTNNLTTGSNNTLIGYNSAATSATVSNEITLGNSSIATLRCQVTTITALSDARDKTNIEALDAGLDFVNQLRPVRFTWNMRDGGKVGEVDTGFIAQELKAVQEQTNTSIPGLVYESNPERLEAGYGKLLPVLVKAIQELSAEVASLKAQLEAKNV